MDGEDDVRGAEKDEEEDFEMISKLSGKVAGSIKALGSARAENAALADQVAVLTAQVSSLNKLKGDLSTALAREQDQRMALLDAFRSSSGETASIWSEQQRTLESENSSLREDLHKLRFAFGVQAERTKEARRGWMENKAMLEKRLEEAELKLEKWEGTIQEDRQDLSAMRNRLAAADGQISTLQAELRREREESTRLREKGDQGASDEVERRLELETLRGEVSRLVDRFQHSLQDERGRHQDEMRTAKREMALWKERCQELELKLEKKDSQLVAQGAILRSLDSSLDRLIKN
jgi:predicted  nucleic acid-binding Zn-ribbon protein